MTFKAIIFSLLSLVLLLMCTCSETIGPNNKIVFPEEGEVSFQNHVLPFLKVKCAFSGCHDDVYRAGGRDMTTHFQVTAATENTGLVVATNPDGSVLVQVIEGTNPHLDYYRINITENQKQGVRRWILDGALNN